MITKRSIHMPRLTRRARIQTIAVLRRTLRQRDYQPVFEDWLWHAALPMLAYAALLHSGVMLARASTDVLYVTGAATLLLVFIGIHNAWDTVMYITVQGMSEPAPEPPPPAAAAAPRSAAEARPPAPAAPPAQAPPPAPGAPPPPAPPPG